MGSKLVRDFVPGMRLAGEGAINGTITVANESERALLGARKVVEEAKELLEVVEAALSNPNKDCSKALSSEVGDVFEALEYTASQLKMDWEAAAERKADTHGRFSQHFVWTWAGDEQPKTIGADGRKHDAGNSLCPWNDRRNTGAGDCTCPTEE